MILVIYDIEGTRHGTENLLTASGYEVRTARNEEEAAQQAAVRRPNLILLSLGLDGVQAPCVAQSVRESAGVDERYPVVVFSVTG